LDWASGTLPFASSLPTFPGVWQRKVIWAGLAAGVVAHILQGMAAYSLLDRFFLENPDLVRDSGREVAVIYLSLNLLVGLVISHLAWYLKDRWSGPDWLVGIKVGFIVWVVSSPVYIITRQVILALSPFLYLEILTDCVVYIMAGAVAGWLVGRGITEKRKDKTDDRYNHAIDPGQGD
jgi:hypothetical protein